MVAETGVEPYITENDMKEYVHNVLKEITADKNRNLKWHVLIPLQNFD